MMVEEYDGDGTFMLTRNLQQHLKTGGGMSDDLLGGYFKT